MRRTAIINQIRGLLLEGGITLGKGRRHLDASLPGILEDGTTKLSGAARLLLAQLKTELDQLVIRALRRRDTLIKKIAQESEVCRRLDAIPALDHLRRLHSSRRSVTAPPVVRARVRCLGWVWCRENTPPEATETARHQQTRELLSTKIVRTGRTRRSAIPRETVFRLSAWLVQLASRIHHKVVGVALANKSARMAWAVLVKREAYRPNWPVAWPCGGAWLTLSLEIAYATPHIRRPATARNLSLLSGLQANYEMAQRSNPVLSKP
jgi:transposase